MLNEISTVPLPPESPAKMLDVRRVAALLVCSTRHIYRLSDAGKMPRPMHLGGLVRWRAAEIESWIAAGCPAVRNVSKSGAK